MDGSEAGFAKCEMSLWRVSAKLYLNPEVSGLQNQELFSDSVCQASSFCLPAPKRSQMFPAGPEESDSSVSNSWVKFTSCCLKVSIVNALVCSLGDC